jgi:hypothetical protein
VEGVKAVIAANPNDDMALANFGQRGEYRRESVAAVAALQASAERLKTTDKRSSAGIVPDGTTALMREAHDAFFTLFLERQVA